MHAYKKHLFFDLDDTVTLTRTPMEEDVRALYSALPHNIVIVSGGTVSQIQTQTHNLPFFRLGQNGNQAVDRAGETLWEEELSEGHSKVVLGHIDKLKKHFTHLVRDENDLIEHRGSQISFNLLGHHEDIHIKKAFDPDRKRRFGLLEKVPFIHSDLEVKIGGSSTFDYFQKGRHKGYNIRRFINHMNWNANDCLYFGDSLFPGGNDETVVGVIETIPVRDHRHTFELLKEQFAQYFKAN